MSVSTISTPLLGAPHYRNARQALQKRVELMRDREALMAKVREFDAAIGAIDDVVVPKMEPGVDLHFGMLGPEGSYYTASLDRDGELRVVRARSAGTVKLPEPPTKAFGDLTDESLTKELRDEFRRRPHTIAMRPRPKAVDCPAGDLTDDDVVFARSNAAEAVFGQDFNDDAPTLLPAETCSSHSNDVGSSSNSSPGHPAEHVSLFASLASIDQEAS